MISTKGRYALRLLLGLASQDSDEYIPLRTIAQRQNISEKYLQIVIREMVQAKLIKGISGKKGGYRLTRKPSEYTVGEVLYLEETSISPVSCLLPEAEPCDRKSTCLTLPMWEKYDRLTKDFFYGITIQDLLDGKI